MIWYYKFELLNIASIFAKGNLKDISQLMYIDCGAMRGDRIRFFKRFIDDKYIIKNLNTIIINYTEKLMNKDINIDKMCNSGEHEIGCGHMSFSLKFIPELYEMFITQLNECITNNYVTTEQRIFTLIMRNKYKTNPELFTLKQHNGCGYTCVFSM
jgi:hypothetical protein